MLRLSQVRYEIPRPDSVGAGPRVATPSDPWRVPVCVLYEADGGPRRACTVLDAASALRNSPMFGLPARPLPLVFSYAPSETDEFKRQTETFLAACRAVGCPCQFVAMPGTNHFDLVLATADPTSALTTAILQTLKRAGGPG